LPAALSAASLVLGILLGALIFGGGSGGGKKDKDPKDPKQEASAAPTTPCPEVKCPAPATAVVPAVGANADAGAAAATNAADAGGAAVVAVVGGGADAGVAVGPATPTGPSLGLGNCSVHIESYPTGAKLTIDGHDAGTTPADVSGAPCDTDVTVSLTKDRFDPYEKKLKLVESPKAPQKLVAAMRHPLTSLAVTSTPPGATVTINGRAVGKTPINTQVFVYLRTPVKVTLAGYKDWNGSVAPIAKDPQKLAATLEKDKTKVVVPFGNGTKKKPTGGSTTPKKTPK
jgi:hypothetical protein